MRKISIETSGKENRTGVNMIRMDVNSNIKFVSE